MSRFCEIFKGLSVFSCPAGADGRSDGLEGEVGGGQFRVDAPDVVEVVGVGGRREGVGGEGGVLGQDSRRGGVAADLQRVAAQSGGMNPSWERTLNTGLSTWAGMKMPSSSCVVRSTVSMSAVRADRRRRGSS